MRFPGAAALATYLSRPGCLSQTIHVLERVCLGMFGPRGWCQRGRTQSQRSPTYFRPNPSLRIYNPLILRRFCFIAPLARGPVCSSAWGRLGSSFPIFVSVCLGALFLVCFYRPLCLSVSLSLCLSLCLSICLSVCLSAYLSVCLSVCLSACLSVCLSVCLSFCVSVCLPICLSSYARTRPHGAPGRRGGHYLRSARALRSVHYPAQTGGETGPAYGPIEPPM